MQSWSIQKDQIRECSITNIESSDPSKCELDIHDCLPEKVQTFLGLTPEKAGPNCHNLTLVMKGMTSSLYSTAPAEILGFLNDSPLCRHLGVNEARLPGDVGFISGETIFDMHSFIYLSEEFYISKNGAGVSQYGIFNSSFVKKGYNVSDNEECNQNNSPPSKLCLARTNFYRCMSMDDYLKGKKLVGPYENAVKATAKFEAALECNNFGYKVDTKPIKQAAKDSLKILRTLLKELKYKVIEGDSTAEENNFLLGSLSLKLKSLEDNIMFFETKPGIIGSHNDNFNSEYFHPKHKKDAAYFL